MFCLPHTDNRTWIQICFLYPFHTVALCLQGLSYDSLGQYFVKEIEFFFLALMKTSMKNTAVVSLVKQVFVNKVTKGII